MVGATAPQTQPQSFNDRQFAKAGLGGAAFAAVSEATTPSTTPRSAVAAEQFQFTPPKNEAERKEMLQDFNYAKLLIKSKPKDARVLLEKYIPNSEAVDKIIKSGKVDDMIELIQGLK